MTAAIAYCRAQQLRAAGEIIELGWNERGAVLGMADYFAEEFLLEHVQDPSGMWMARSAARLTFGADRDICRDCPDCLDSTVGHE